MARSFAEYSSGFRGASSVPERALEGQWGAVRPLRGAAAAEQCAKRNVTSLEPQLPRAGVFGRDEFSSASAAKLVVVGREVFQRKNRIGHGAQCNAASRPVLMFRPVGPC